MNVGLSAPTAARAFLQAELLRRIELEPAQPIGSLANLARELGRDASNTRRSVQALEKDGLILTFTDGGLQLTDLGRRSLVALDVAEGRSDVAGGILQVKHGNIRPNPLNPRTMFDDGSVAELADSIAGVDQVLVPLIVFPADEEGVHTLAAGERRWRAVRALIEDGRWPAGRPLPCIEREHDAAQAALIGLVENGQREDLNLYDQALAYVALMDATGWSAREAAKRTGKSARAVQEAVQVVRDAKPDEIEAFRNGQMKWEDLRRGVRRPADKRLVDLVMSDHPDDVAELETRTARGMAQLSTESAQARAFSTSAQVDIEDIAPTQQPPPKPAAKAIEQLPPQQLLILLEIAAKICREDGPSYFVTEISYAAIWQDSPNLKALIDRYWLMVHGPRSDTGRYSAQLLSSGRHYIDAYAPRFIEDEDVRVAVLKRAREGGFSDLDDGAEYATRWLNGPFDLGKEGREVLAQYELAEQERAQASANTTAAAEAEQKRGATYLERALGIEAALRAGTLEALSTDHIQQACAEGGAPLPWAIALDGNIVDANGAPLIAMVGAPLEARRRLMVAGVNALAGLDTPEIPPTSAAEDDDVLDRAAFEAAIAAELVKDGQMDATQAAEIAQTELDETLETNSIAFGDEDWDWTAAGAREIATEYGCREMANDYLASGET